MDEKDKIIQELRRANIALLLELHAVKECFTCSHYHEVGIKCDQYMFGNDCREYTYEWRGVEEAEKWHEEQERKQMLEQLLGGE